MAKLSVVINAQNAEKDLPRALASIKDLADEIVVIDQGSTDNTSKIAKEFGAKIYNHEPVTYVELTRNFAISKATSDWILILDPDEEIGKELASEIKKVIKEDKADYFRIPRKNIIFGKWIAHTLWWPDYQTRLFKKGKVSWSEVIHSVPITIDKGADLKPEENLAIIHHNYNSIEEYLEKLNRYTSVQADILIKDGYTFNWKDLIGKPFKEFIVRYFTGQGYKDGVHGLALSLLQAFSELVVYIKVWQLAKFTKENIGLKSVVTEMRSKEKELHYWQSDASFKETGKFADRIKRKLRI